MGAAVLGGGRTHRQSRPGVWRASDDRNRVTDLFVGISTIPLRQEPFPHINNAAGIHLKEIPCFTHPSS